MRGSDNWNNPRYHFIIANLAVYIVWDVHEQVCIAALDCGDQDTAEVCVSMQNHTVLGALPSFLLFAV